MSIKQSVKLFIYLFVVMLLVTCGNNNNDKPVDILDDNEELQIIKNRICDEVWAQGYRYCEVSLDEKPIKDDKGGYYLASIDYSSNKPAEWPVIGHLEYIMAYLRSIGNERLKTDIVAQKLIKGMLDYWLRNNFKNTNNWYWNQLGVPYDMADICIMFSDYLDNQQLDKIENILDRATYGRDISFDEILPESNSADWMDISIKHAVVYKNKDLLKKYVGVFDRLVDFSKTKGYGIQNDYTYFQYSVLASGGSYAAVYVRNMAYFLSVLHGTEYQLNKRSVRLFIDFLLEGQRFFNRGYGAPHFAIARSAVFANGGEDFYNALSRIVQLKEIYRKNELQDYYASFKDFSVINPITRCFEEPGVMVHISKDSYFAVRGCKEGYSMTNVQNQEGVLNYNLSYGSNTCY